MKLKITEQGLSKAVQYEKETKSRRGRTSKNKGSKFERDVAKQLQDAYATEFIRTPMSGGFFRKSESFRGDIMPADCEINFKLHCELKCVKKWTLKNWINQAKKDAPKEKIPIVCFHKHDTKFNYVAILEKNFYELIEGVK